MQRLYELACELIGSRETPLPLNKCSPCWLSVFACASVSKYLVQTKALRKKLLR